MKLHEAIFYEEILFVGSKNLLFFRTLAEWNRQKSGRIRGFLFTWSETRGNTLPPPFPDPTTPSRRAQPKARQTGRLSPQLFPSDLDPIVEWCGVVLLYDAEILDHFTTPDEQVTITWRVTAYSSRLLRKISITMFQNNRTFCCQLPLVT